MGLDHLCSTGSMKTMVTLFPSIPASLDTFFNFSNGVFFPIGTLENHDIVGFVGVLLQWLQMQSSLLIANTGMKLVDMHVQEMNVTSQLCWSCIVASAVHWYCHQSFGPENLGPLDWNFQQKNGHPGPLSVPGNSVQVMQIGKTVSGTLNTCKEVFSISTAPTFPLILLPVWSLSLTGWELLSWDSARR